jgi:hypothetical protein
MERVTEFSDLPIFCSYFRSVAVENHSVRLCARQNLAVDVTKNFPGKRLVEGLITLFFPRDIPSLYVLNK